MPIETCPARWRGMASARITYIRRPCILCDMSLEAEARRGRRKDYIQKSVLSTLAVAGLLLWSMAAPNTVQLLDKLGGKRSARTYRLKRTATRLAERGLVCFVDRSGKRYLEITEQGRKMLAFEQQKMALQRRAKKRWDGRWRMIVFDIPEKYRATRDRLRTALRSLGFAQLQGSVWVYPHDCEEVTTLLKADLELGSNVLYVIVDRIEFDQRLRRHFKLTQ